MTRFSVDEDRIWILEHIASYSYTDYQVSETTLEVRFVGGAIDYARIHTFNKHLFFYFFLFFEDRDSMRRVAEMVKGFDVDELLNQKKYMDRMETTAEHPRLSWGLLLPSDIISAT